MHYIRQLFSGEVEDWVHLLFIRYGRGEFLGPVCEVKIKKNIRFKGTVEYCNVFGWLAASSGGDYEVKGSIYGKVDFRDELRALGVEFNDKSKVKKGYFVAEVECELPGAVLADAYVKMPYATILLNLKGGNAKLKCRKKPPKPGKGKELEFCSGVLDSSVLDKLREEVFFDAPGFSEARVDNTFVIDELVIPEGSDAVEARLHAKRKGRLLRSVVADGVEKKSECQILV